MDSNHKDSKEEKRACANNRSFAFCHRVILNGKRPALDGGEQEMETARLLETMNEQMEKGSNYSVLVLKLIECIFRNTVRKAFGRCNNVFYLWENICKNSRTGTSKYAQPGSLHKKLKIRDT